MRHGRAGADSLCGVELVSILGGRGAQVMFSLLEPAAVPGEHWSLPAHNCLSAARPQTTDPSLDTFISNIKHLLGQALFWWQQYLESSFFLAEI